MQAQAIAPDSIVDGDMFLDSAPAGLGSMRRCPTSGFLPMPYAPNGRERATLEGNCLSFCLVGGCLLRSFWRTRRTGSEDRSPVC